MEEDIKLLDSRVGIEEQLRSRYSFSKEGEKVLVIIDDEPDIEAEPEKKGIIKKTMSWFSDLNLIE